MKALFKTVLYFLSEAKNVRISYVYETHEIEFIMPGSLMTGLNPEQFCGVYFDYCLLRPFSLTSPLFGQIGHSDLGFHQTLLRTRKRSLFR